MVNKIILIGNLGKEPELRHTQNNTAYLKVSMATTETWYDKQTKEKKKETSWHNLVFWGKSAETIQRYCSKGSKLYIEGSMQYGSYEKNGVKHYTADVKVREFEFLDSKQDNTREEPARVGTKSDAFDQYDDTEDIPF